MQAKPLEPTATLRLTSSNLPSDFLMIQSSLLWVPGWLILFGLLRSTRQRRPKLGLGQAQHSLNRSSRLPVWCPNRLTRSTKLLTEPGPSCLPSRHHQRDSAVGPDPARHCRPGSATRPSQSRSPPRLSHTAWKDKQNASQQIILSYSANSPRSSVLLRP